MRVQPRRQVCHGNTRTHRLTILPVEAMHYGRWGWGLEDWTDSLSNIYEQGNEIMKHHHHTSSLTAGELLNIYKMQHIALWDCWRCTCLALCSKYNNALALQRDNKYRGEHCEVTRDFRPVQSVPAFHRRLIAALFSPHDVLCSIRNPEVDVVWHHMTDQWQGVTH